MTIRISTEMPTAGEILALYRAVGWTAYTDDADRLIAALAASHAVFAARDEDGALVGLARTVSDGLTIAYVQDILVAPEQHRRGIGGALLEAVLAATQHIRQVVLLTDDEGGQRAFYESRGFTEAHDVAPNPLRSFVRLG